jgi:TolA-binding protein
MGICTKAQLVLPVAGWEGLVFVSRSRPPGIALGACLAFAIAIVFVAATSSANVQSKPESAQSKASEVKPPTQSAKIIPGKFVDVIVAVKFQHGIAYLEKNLLWSDINGQCEGRLESSCVLMRILAVTSLLLAMGPGMPVWAQQSNEYEQARTLINQQRYPAAEKALRDFAAAHVDRADALYLLGYVLFREDRPADSLKM